MRVPNRSLAAVLVLAALSCKPAPPPPAPVARPAAAAWPDERTRPLAELARAEDGSLSLQLRHVPASGALEARLELALLDAGQRQVIWEGAVDPAQRDGLWGASWSLAAEPAPGERLAVSADGGANWSVIFRSSSRPILCPHLAVPGQGGMPLWEKAPTLAAWAAQVLQTAVWNCDAAGACKSQSLGGGPVHQGGLGAASLLARPRLDEVQVVLELLETLPIDRRLAMALFDASVGYQEGLGAPELERLAKATAKTIGPEGPLDTESRRALTLRLSLAKSEAKRTPPSQLSPRLTLEKLSAALQAPALETVGAKGGASSP